MERRTPRPCGLGAARPRRHGSPDEGVRGSIFHFLVNYLALDFVAGLGASRRTRREIGNPEERRNRLPHFGSGGLKYPSFPPVAMGSSVSGLVDLTAVAYCATSSTHFHSAKSGQFVSEKIKLLR
jgi:hypothetical protein